MSSLKAYAAEVGRVVEIVALSAGKNEVCPDVETVAALVDAEAESGVKFFDFVLGENFQKERLLGVAPVLKETVGGYGVADVVVPAVV